VAADAVRVRSRLEHQLDVVSVAVLLAVLTLMTVVFGGVLSWTWTTALCAVTAVVVARGALATRRGEVELPPSWILGSLIAVWCWAAFQAVALPPALSGPPSGLPNELAQRLATAMPADAWRPLALDFGGCLGALQQGALYVLAFGLAWSLGRAGYARWFLFGLMVLGCFEAFYGMLEQVSGNAEIFGYVKPTSSARASGTYVNSNHYAGFLGMALPAGIGVALGLRRGQRLEGFWLRLREGLTRPDAPKRALLVGAAFLIAVGLVASLSRGGSLAALLGIAVLAGVGARRNRKRSVVVLAIAASLGLWIALLGAERLQARFGQLEDLGDRGASRIAFLRDTASMIKGFPLRGTGVGSYETVFTGVASEDYGVIVSAAHCDVVQVVAELGIPAGLLLLGLIVGCFVSIARGVLRSERSRGADGATLLACASPLVLHSWFDFNLHIPANALWWTVILGLALGCVGPAGRTVQLPRAKGLGEGLIGVCAGVGLLLSWSAVCAAQSDWHARPFVERAQGDQRPYPIQAMSQAEAIRLWPFVAQSHHRLALFNWMATYEEQQRQAEEVARSVLDPKNALESEIKALQAQGVQARLNTAPVRIERSWSAFQVQLGRELAPAHGGLADLAEALTD